MRWSHYCLCLTPTPPGAHQRGRQDHRTRGLHRRVEPLFERIDADLLVRGYAGCDDLTRQRAHHAAKQRWPTRIVRCEVAFNAEGSHVFQAGPVMQQRESGAERRVCAGTSEGRPDPTQRFVGQRHRGLGARRTEAEVERQCLILERT